MANNNSHTVNPIQVQKYLKGIDYPTKKEQLLGVAKDHGADENIMATLKKIPDQEFESPTDVTKAIGDLS